MAKKRNLFDELNQGFTALAEQRAGKRMLRTHTVKAKAAILAGAMGVDGSKEKTHSGSSSGFLGSHVPGFLLRVRFRVQGSEFVVLRHYLGRGSPESEHRTSNPERRIEPEQEPGT